MDEQNSQLQDNAEENQYLTFLIKNEMFAMGVLYVKEIIEYALITRVPQMQKCVLGVTNVRGNVIPVLDLSERLALDVSDIMKRTCIIIVEIHDGHDKIDIGLLIDSVNQVHEITEHNTEDAPGFGSKIRKDFIKKMGKIGNKFIVILNLENIVNVAEISKTTLKQLN